MGSDSMSWDPNGYGTSNPDTGDANSPIGRFFQGAFGKHGSTTARLPANLQWINDFTKNLATGAPVNYGAPNSAQQAGITGANSLGTAAAGTLPGTANAFNAGVGGITEGSQTGFMPSLEGIDAILRPGVERSFNSGAADIREQNALTGNLSSSGASQQVTDYRAQLENDLNKNVASIYGGALPASIGARSSLSQAGAELPGFNASNIYTPAANVGNQGFQSILSAIQTAFGGISAAPYSANQGSGGSGGGQALGGLMSKGCWVAEAIFGRGTTETELARFYVNELAPCEFRDWYMAHGQSLAALVRENGELRRMLRPLFMWFATQAAEHMLSPVTVH